MVKLISEEITVTSEGDEKPFEVNAVGADEYSISGWARWTDFDKI
jgi:hypothetical protein